MNRIDPLQMNSVRLSLESYVAEFEEMYWRANAFWKLEVGQVFAEPGNDSWLAFSRGDWDESLSLLQGAYGSLVDNQGELARKGGVARRVRVVEFPLSPYLQWELHALRLRDRAGGSVRVFDLARRPELKRSPFFNEFYTLGDQVLYCAVYDDAGVLEAVDASYDSTVVRQVRDFISDLYVESEPIADFWSRDVKHLPPPSHQGSAVESGYFEVHSRHRPPRL